jgi:hypothetical protein
MAGGCLFMALAAFMLSARPGARASRLLTLLLDEDLLALATKRPQQQQDKEDSGGQQQRGADRVGHGGARIAMCYNHRPSQMHLQHRAEDEADDERRRLKVQLGYTRRSATRDP